ncbi:MAG: FliI/YscN family ATPase [Pirellulales bacterium]
MQPLLHELKSSMTTALTGSVLQTVGTTAAVADFPAPVGAIVDIERQSGEPVRAEVIGFRDSHTIVYPYHSLSGVRRGSRVRLVRTARRVRVGPELLGRVIDAHGRCVDLLPQPVLVDRVRFDQAPLAAVQRPRIDTALATGVRAIDGLLCCGCGQRMGVFSGSGVGKSVLLGMMGRYTSADVIVIALIGERGREVNEFIERDLGPQGLARSVVVVATSDEPALVRVHAADTATAVAEYFRDRGQNVLLLMDSVTRFAMAQREIGLAAGEPPTTRGYPPSVFALLPKLVERAGRTPEGSITAFYSVLVEGDDDSEPISDTVRGLLDGHTWLSRKIASRGHYPAIDVLSSISRLVTEVATTEQRSDVQVIRELLSAYRDHEDLISIGAYRRGANRAVDAAIDMREAIDGFLRQDTDDQAELANTRARLKQLADQCRARLQGPQMTKAQAAPAAG